MLYVGFLWRTLRGPHMVDAWEPFLFRSTDPGRLFFFFPFWRGGNSFCLAALIQADCLYYTVRRKPTPTAEREADLFTTEILLQNWNKLMHQVAQWAFLWGLLQMFLELWQAIIYWSRINWSTQCQQMLKKLEWTWHVPIDYGNVLKRSVWPTMKPVHFCYLFMS